MATARCRPSKSLARAAFRHGFLQLARIAAEAQPRSVFDKRRDAIFKGLPSRVAWIDRGIGVCGGSLLHLWFTLSEHRRRRRRIILLILVTPPR